GAAPSRGALPPGPLVVFVHMASVWVPFTSESKEAIADYDEIRREIKLALQECGRRLGVFLRRRERAQSEFRRRNIFELYIEEVVEACARLKGGKLPKDKLRTQLQRIATRRTGGSRTARARTTAPTASRTRSSSPPTAPTELRRSCRTPSRRPRRRRKKSRWSRSGGPRGAGVRPRRAGRPGRRRPKQPGERGARRPGRPGAGSGREAWPKRSRRPQERSGKSTAGSPPT